MMPDSTSVGYKNPTHVQVGEFRTQLPGLRHMAGAPGDVIGGKRERGVVKFGWRCFNYFAANVRSGPILLAQGRRGLIQQVAQELQRMVDGDPPKHPTQGAIVCC